MTIPKLIAINGPVLTVAGGQFTMAETVMVDGLLGEVIALNPNTAIVQIYESPTGLTLNAAVKGLGKPMSVTLRPGIVGHIFDGIMRPLETQLIYAEGWGASMPPSGETHQLLYYVEMLTHPGETLNPGQPFAVTQETPSIQYKALLPPNLSGTVIHINPNAHYSPNCTIATLKSPDGIIHNLTLSQTWPIRIPRPVHSRHAITRPLITGQRVIDCLFPIAKGGVAAIPGGFGTGKTMTQHQLAKWCDADLIVYIGCGERGNEMTEVLEDFKKLIDPRTNEPLLSRTILIANTSDMPVASREASIYTGLTIAECYRDMGLHVAVMADSTSRWAEALRELSGRLEEIPAEEGYPAYLASRLSAFYGRAGYVQTLGSHNNLPNDSNEGSITIIGAVSPQGADFSEPVTQNTKRFVRTFWALDRRLAYARHFPAIDWMHSYSGYIDELSDWYEKNISPNFMNVRNNILAILQAEHALMEIVKLIGQDSLSKRQQTILATAKNIRENFLQQNAYDPNDTFVPIEKQFAQMQAYTGE